MVAIDTFVYRSQFDCSVEELYDFHKRPGALERLLPPWDGSEVLWKQGTIAPGSKVLVKLQQGPLKIKWEGHHIEEVPGVRFCDIQHRGPFASYRHTHSFFDSHPGALLEDRIEFALPIERFLPAAAHRQIKKTLARLFVHREHILREDLRLHGRYSQRPLRLLVSGASGVLGKVLVPMLTTGGHEVWTLVRRAPRPGCREIFWDPWNGLLTASQLPELDGVIHLAGEYITLKRWSEEKKQQVVESRRRGTWLLAKTISRLAKPPSVLLSASAVGYYGDGGSQWIDEGAPCGDHFISEVCQAWEWGTTPAAEAGIRTVQMRLGVALTPRGGALQRMLTTDPFCIIRQFGDGKQYISWMSVDDMVAAMLHCLVTPGLSGPVNIAAPQPVSNSEMLATLAQVADRPLALSIPAALLKTLYGQMASELVLSGCRVSTKKLVDSGFTFRHPTLASALRAQLGKTPAPDRG